MRLKKINDLPPEMRNGATEYYYAILKKKRVSLFFKRCFDVVVSLFLLALLSPVMLVVAIAIKIDSRGPVFYRQTRVTQYNKTFRIFKFRTMVANADKIGTQVTVNGDPRITRVGRLIRKVRIDELPQLYNVLRGDMSIVGPRPALPREVAQYDAYAMQRFIVSPGLSVAVANICNEKNIPYYPGCVTPTEIMQALDLGINTVKFFPANIYGGLKALKALSAPFPQVKFIPTGGVDRSNIDEFLAFDKVAAIGGSFFVKEALEKMEANQ